MESANYGHSDLHFLTLTAKNAYSWDSKYRHQQKPNFRFFVFFFGFSVFFGFLNTDVGFGFGFLSIAIFSFGFGYWLGYNAGRPRPRLYCVRWRSGTPTERGTTAPTFLIYGRRLCLRPYNQWIKMKLGREVGLSLPQIVLNGDPPPLPQTQRGSALPNFRPMPVVAKRLDGSKFHCHSAGR